MKRFNNKRNNRHGDKHKSDYITNIEHKCRCSKLEKECDKIKHNFKQCLNHIVQPKDSNDNLHPEDVCLIPCDNPLL